MEQVTLETAAKLLVLTTLVYGGMAVRVFLHHHSVTSTNFFFQLFTLGFTYYISFATTSMQGALLAQLMEKTMRLKFEPHVGISALDVLGRDKDSLVQLVDLSIDHSGGFIDVIVGLGLLFYMVGRVTWLAAMCVIGKIIV